MNPNEIPDFLIKSTFACSAVNSIILLPFLIYEIYQGQFLLALLIFLVILGCSINIWNGIKHRYNILLNNYFLAPIGTIAIAYAFVHLGITGSYWPFVLLLANYFVLPEKRTWYFTAFTLLYFIPVSWYVLPPDMAARFTAALMITALFITLSMHEVYKLHALLEEKAITDPLTGLFNRSSLKPFLQHAIAQSKRSSIPMTLISVDIDLFKSINDSFGHDIGDDVLVNLSSLLQKRIRESDRAFRTGGEEFLIFLHNTNTQHAAKFAEALRKLIEQHPLLPNYPITISAGVTSLEKDMNLDTWLKSCDKKLYQAKHQGRNLVIV